MKIDTILRHRYFLLSCRLVLGGIFIAAAWHKLFFPQEFARDVANYRILLSPKLVNLTAVTLPWIELLAGVLLILGIWVRGATTLLTGLLCMFIGMFIVTMARGINIHCGCFGSSNEPGGLGVWEIIRDILFLIPSVFLYLEFSRQRRERRSEPNAG